MTLFRQLLIFYHEASMGAAFYDNGIQPKTTSHYIHRVQRKLTISKIYPLSPLIYTYIYIRYHQSPHVCPHILRGGTFLLFSCRALVPNKSGRTELDTGPNTEESKPEGRLTRGRACRKLGGAGSSPKDTSIIETLRDFFIARRHHPVKQQRARMPCRSWK